MSDWQEGLTRAERDRLKAAEHPNWMSPMLATLTGKRFSDLTEWTADGKLRHPRFLGLRRDKKPREVTRETPDE